MYETFNFLFKFVLASKMIECDVQIQFIRFFSPKRPSLNVAKVFAVKKKKNDECDIIKYVKYT